MLRVEVGIFVGADADEARFVTGNDSPIPAESPAERAHGVGKNFSGVSACVVGKSLACRPVGNPSILHIQHRLEAFWVGYRTLGVRDATQKLSVEPERRIELLTYALRVRCSTD